mgnify:CR=1 FL=1
MNKFLAIIFAYMLSISSAFASDKAESVFADIIASDQGMKAEQVRIIITKGSKELEAAKPAGIRVLSMRIDTRADNFSATVASGYTNKFEVKGKFEKIRLVPVLSQNIKKDAMITASDITYTDISEKQISRGYVTKETDLIGKVAARDIMAGKPVLPTLLASEKLILKGAIVTAIYKSDLLQLQNSVTAMEDGRVGETIRLKNTDSNRVIHGRVTAANTVELTTLNQLASN